MYQVPDPSIHKLLPLFEIKGQKLTTALPGQLQIQLVKSTGNPRVYPGLPAPVPAETRHPWTGTRGYGCEYFIHSLVLSMG